jgi:hypothetical protein
MGVDLKDWLDYVRRHPLLYRFDGLHSYGRSHKSDFHKTVGEAATSDERFMNRYFEEEFESHEGALDEAIKDRKDRDEYLSRFCEYMAGKARAVGWAELFPDLPALPHGWHKVHIDDIMRVVDAFIAEHKEGFIQDWLIGDQQDHWDRLCHPDEMEYLLKDHPPVAVWYHAGGYEIPLRDLFFVCPACHGEPQTEEDLAEFYGKQNGYPYFYCSSCGSEMCVSKHEDIRDFFIAMNIKPYPFNPGKAEEWQKILDARRAMGDNKLELKVGDMVVLKRLEFLDSGARYYANEPGEVVEVTEVHNTTHDVRPDVMRLSGISYIATKNDEAIYGSARFHEIHSRAQVALV